MKLAVSGKGGVGKTTLSALLAKEMVGRGYSVTAIDADPNPTLALALGFPASDAPPLLELREEIEQRVGGSDGFVRLNPRVDDLLERVAVSHQGIRLVVAGAISRGGAGCACPQSVLLRRMLDHVVLERGEAVVVDLEAGLEHLGRRSAQGADALLVVVDTSRGGLETAARIKKLAPEIGLAHVFAVANRVRNQSDEEYLEAHLEGIDRIGTIPYSEALLEGERSGGTTADIDPAVSAAVARLVDELENRLDRRATV